MIQNSYAYMSIFASLDHTGTCTRVHSHIESIIFMNRLCSPMASKVCPDRRVPLLALVHCYRSQIIDLLSTLSVSRIPSRLQPSVYYHSLGRTSLVYFPHKFNYILFSYRPIPSTLSIT